MNNVRGKESPRTVVLQGEVENIGQPILVLKTREELDDGKLHYDALEAVFSQQDWFWLLKLHKENKRKIVGPVQLE